MVYSVIVVSEIVLPVADLGEDLDFAIEVAPGMALGRGDDLGLGAAQERVGGQFVADARGQGGLAARALGGLARLALGERAIAGLDRLGEGDVGEGVFVPA